MVAKSLLFLQQVGEVMQREAVGVGGEEGWVWVVRELMLNISSVSGHIHKVSSFPSASSTSLFLFY